MSQARSVVATFSLPTKQKLTITKAKGGTVSSVPAGIKCGSTCSHSYSYGMPVTLKAVAASGFVFVGWSGASTGTRPTCQLTMTAARATTAKFAPPKLLTVVRAGKGSGTVKSSPAGISCGSTCTHKFAPGAMVTLTATPKSGSTFTGWTGACSGTGSCVVTMSAARTVKANFG
jgi:endoglucanase